MKHRMLLLVLERFADRLFIFSPNISGETVKFRMDIMYFLDGDGLIIFTGLFSNKLI